MTLEDALALLELMAEARDPRFDRAAVRWIARLAGERRNATLADVAAAAAAFQALDARGS